jgi:excisionase family DNA binding protein
MTSTQQTLTNKGASPMAERDRLVLTITEAAEVLGISRAFAYELCARGDLPVIRLGRRRLVPKKALLALVGGDVEAPTSPQPVVAASLHRLVPETAVSR